MKKDKRNLEGSYELKLQGVCSTERIEGTVKFETLELHEKMCRIQREFEEFNEITIRLGEDHKLLKEREERIARQYAKLSDDHGKMESEKTKTIAELNEKLDVMKNQIQERDQIIEKRDQIIEECKKKVDCSETKLLEMESELQDLKHQKLEADEIINELNIKQLESDRAMEELRRSNLKAFKTLEDLKCQKVDAEKASKNDIEKLLTKLVRVEEDLTTLLNIKVDDLPDVVRKVQDMMENEKVAFPGFKGDTDSGQCVVTSPEVQSTFKFGDNACDDLPKRGQSVVFVEIIEIVDSDGERDRGADKSTGVSLMSLSQKRKRITSEFDDPGSLIYRHKGKQIEKSTGAEDSDDESCSDSNINAFIQIQKSQSQGLSKTWMSETDMKEAFQVDDHLCMNAVCALYRKQKLSSESPVDLLHHFNAMGGQSMVEYLIDGDPHLRLRKSPSDAIKEMPDVINLCRRLALDYSEKLFSMYCTTKDNFFKSSWP